MNPQFFVSQARRWNRAMLCAMLCNEPEAIRATYKAHRTACMKRAKAFKARDRLRALARIEA